MEDDGASMEYKNFHTAVVQKYCVNLIGYKVKPMHAPSKLGNALPIYERIHNAIESGNCYFKKLTDAEYDELDREFEEAIASGKIKAPRKRKRHSDAGVKRKRVDDSEEDENDNDAGEEDEGIWTADHSLHSKKQLTSNTLILLLYTLLFTLQCALSTS
jgi:hypothetical protein